MVRKFIRVILTVLAVLAVVFMVFSPTKAKADNYDYGVSKQYWQTEKEVGEKCYKYDTNQKKFDKCAKEVSLKVKKRLTNEKRILLAKGKK